MRLDPYEFEGPAGKATPTDVLDAIAAAWVASKAISGEAKALGQEEPLGTDDVPIWT